MIEVKIETDDEVKVYEFPENWDEITVEKFCNVYRQNYDNGTEFEGSIYLLSALSGIEKEIIEKNIDLDEDNNWPFVSDYAKIMNVDLQKKMTGLKLEVKKTKGDYPRDVEIKIKAPVPSACWPSEVFWLEGPKRQQCLGREIQMFKCCCIQKYPSCHHSLRYAPEAASCGGCSPKQRSWHFWPQWAHT